MWNLPSIVVLWSKCINAYSHDHWIQSILGTLFHCLEKKLIKMTKQKPIILKTYNQPIGKWQRYQNTMWIAKKYKKTWADVILYSHTSFLIFRQTMRFKPPPPNSEIGWRIEFRPCELQFTDFENAAVCCFVVLLTRVILSYKYNILVPISKVDENMKRAQKRDAILNQRFYFRRNITDR